MKIKNGDLPAMPIYLTDTVIAATDNGAGAAVDRISGMTKREHIAAMAMAAILSKPDTTMSYAAREGVMFADELLAELERTK